MKKTILVITGVICLPIVLLGVGLTFEWLVNLVTPHPPRPEITYGEFPFRVEYEINGELVVVEDTIICKFDGFSSLSCDIDTKYREWKASFASGRKTLFPNGADLKVDDDRQIYFSLGSAHYYMGDGWGGSPHCRAYKARKSSSGYSLTDIPPDELFNTYNIRVISYEFSPPIVNSFK